MDSDRPIGIFDSGVGGLSVLRWVQAELPHEDLLFFADQGHVPYGPRPAGQLQQFSTTITQYLLDQDAKLIIIACNTATASALTHLRKTFPHVPFVGMEPAIKSGATQTKTGQVGVLATATTFESQRYASLMARFAQHVTLYENPCRGLVERIEAGELDTPETHAFLQEVLTPMLAAGVDTFVLGCTHYPFIAPLIQRLVGSAALIDPAPAVIRQTKRLLKKHTLLATRTRPGTTHTYTTASAPRLTHQIQTLLNQTLPVTPLKWHNLTLHT